MLSHANLLYQVQNLSYFLPVAAGQTTLSLLPPWHIYERSVGCAGRLAGWLAGWRGTTVRRCLSINDPCLPHLRSLHSPTCHAITCRYYLYASGACQTYSNIRKCVRALLGLSVGRRSGGGGGVGGQFPSRRAATLVENEEPQLELGLGILVWRSVMRCPPCAPASKTLLVSFRVVLHIVLCMRPATPCASSSPCQPAHPLCHTLRFREDLTVYPPDFFVCVPLVRRLLQGGRHGA